jgi:hypothetical protein
MPRRPRPTRSNPLASLPSCHHRLTTTLPPHPHLPTIAPSPPCHLASPPLPLCLPTAASIKRQHRMKRRRGRATGCWLEVKKPHLEEKEEAAHQSVREDAQPVHHGGGGRTSWRPGPRHQREEGASSPSLNPTTRSGLEEDATIDDEVRREKETATSPRRASSPDHAAMLKLVHRGKEEGRGRRGRRKVSSRHHAQPASPAAPAGSQGSRGHRRWRRHPACE